ncbi:MAG: phosphoribosylglycinamide formyltransferase [Ilumatobacteraceae bacterium]
MTRIVVLASGSGTNLQALLDAQQTNGLGNGRIVAVISDRPAAKALQRAIDAGVAAHPLPPTEGEQRSDYDRRLSDLIRHVDADLVVLAGWMRILTDTVVKAHRVINLHPALPGELPGVRAIERAFDEFTAGVRSQTGVMVHEVPDEGVDSGPVLASAIVPIEPADSLEDLENRIHATEHRLLVDTVAQLCGTPSIRTGEPDGTPQ